MRILIGTLYTIENEYEACLAALQQQSHLDWEHFIIEGLPDREAHDALYQTFMARAAEFDLFLKLDADMVLRDAGMLKRIVHKFREREDLDLLSVCVYDFYTGRLIQGLNTFRSSVRWTVRTDDIFTDVHNVPRERVLVDCKDLAPAADHCPDPSPFQAFHFGLHRGVKAMAARRMGRKGLNTLATRLNELHDVWRRFEEMKNTRLGFASLGGELALAGQFKPEDVSYNNPYAARLFAHEYANWDVPQLEQEVGRLRRRNCLRMPWLEMYRSIAWFLLLPRTYDMRTMERPG